MTTGEAKREHAHKYTRTETRARTHTRKYIHAHTHTHRHARADENCKEITAALRRRACLCFLTCAQQTRSCPEIIYFIMAQLWQPA